MQSEHFGAGGRPGSSWPWIVGGTFAVILLGLFVGCWLSQAVGMLRAVAAAVGV